MDKINSDDTAAKERFDRWSDYLDRIFMPLQLEPVGDDPFHVAINARQVNELAIVNVSGAGCDTVRGSHDVARTREHFYIASMHLSGKSSLTVGNIEKPLARGDVFLIDTMHELTLGVAQPYEHLLIKIPTQWLDAQLPRPDLLCGSILSHKDPLLELYSNYLRAGFQMADRLPAHAISLFSNHLVELLCHAISGQPIDPRAASAIHRTTIYAHACKLISLYLSDCSLTPEHIARLLRISTRTLHRAFLGCGKTIMQHVLHERVERAARLLASPVAAKRSVSDVAFSCGFNDLSHFSRAFATQMGPTPSQWRRQHVERLNDIGSG